MTTVYRDVVLCLGFQESLKMIRYFFRSPKKTTNGRNRDVYSIYQETINDKNNTNFEISEIIKKVPINHNEQRGLRL